MNPLTSLHHILIVDPTNDVSWQSALTDQYELNINYVKSEQNLLADIHQTQPDLVVLSTRLPAPSLQRALAALSAQEKVPLVILVGRPGETVPIGSNINDHNIIGWFTAPLTAAELKWLVQAGFELPAAGDLILARRTELMAANQQLRQHLQDLKLIDHISRVVSSTLDVEQIPPLLIQRTAETLKAECGSLALIDQEQETVIFQAAYNGQGHEVISLKNFLMPLEAGVIGRVARTGRPFMTNNVEENVAWSPLVDHLTGFTAKKVIAVPLIVEGKTMGVIELLNKMEGDFTQDDVELLLLVASSAAIALKNARRYAALKKANEALHQAQAQRIATERWTVLGQAAGNLAHRINNSTAIVPLSIQSLRQTLQQVDLSSPVREEVEEKLTRIERNTLYTVELATAMLQRFRNTPSVAHEVDRLIEQALEQVEIPENIRLVRHLDSDLPPVDASDLLIDVLVELVTNALEAMGKRAGLLRIASFIVGDEVSIQLTDSGPGIAEENLDRIFDMFFTTTPQGIGFGLWWIKTYLEQQHGRITVDSHPQQGATFTITLPAAQPPPRPSGSDNGDVL